MMTYRISSRSQYSYLDTDAADRWGYSLIEGLRLANRQGHAQMLRNMLLYGVMQLITRGSPTHRTQ